MPDAHHEIVVIAGGAVECGVAAQDPNVRVRDVTELLAEALDRS